VAGLTRAAAERGLLIAWALIGKGGTMAHQDARRTFVHRTATA
jgi:hypothetical protein